jgi:hypothetical protein
MTAATDPSQPAARVDRSSGAPSLVAIVRALSVTYRDVGVAVWLVGNNRFMDGLVPLHVFCTEGGPERVAAAVCAIGDADPADFEELS